MVTDTEASPGSADPSDGGSMMPRKAWSAKRERQYEHIKEGYEDRGVSEDEAEERAARTVNKERREAGETKAQQSSRRRRR
jgi:plasmid stabilization system protein ParE